MGSRRLSCRVLGIIGSPDWKNNPLHDITYVLIRYLAYSRVPSRGKEAFESKGYLLALRARGS